MARSDLLVNLVKSGFRGERDLFRRTVEAIIAEENAKQHHVLANELAKELHHDAGNGREAGRAPTSSTQSFVLEREAQRTLDSLVLADDTRAAVSQLVEEQQRADLLRSFGLEPRHRVLLIGPPGNGKTSLAEACAGALCVPLLTVLYDAVIGSFLGETGVRVRRLFESVRRQQCVLFFDEFDTIAKERGDEHETGEIKRVVSSLLLEIDRLPSYVVVITATNHPELLDRAVWRRFQLKLELNSPNESQILEWIRLFESRTGQKWIPKACLKDLRGRSYSELEDFALDVARRSLLSPERSHERIIGEAVRSLARRL